MSTYISSTVANGAAIDSAIALAQTALQPESMPISIKNLGAVGDGITDDTAAIQAALDTNDAVIIPPGTYRITSTLNTKDNQTILGFERRSEF
jgi:polygalacturonase